MAQEIKKQEPTTLPPRGYVEPFSALRTEMDRVFDSFLGRGFGGFGRLADFPRVTWGEAAVPSLDVRESDKDFVVEAELPGMDEKDVSLTFASGVLTLKGEKKSEREEKKDDYHLTERQYGSFQRSLELGDAVDAEKVKATFDKGVLKVTLPKLAEAAKAAKRIPIGKA